MILLALFFLPLAFVADEAPDAVRVSEYSVRELEEALRLESYGSATRPSAARMFLRMDPELVPDHLLLAILLSGSTTRDVVEVALDVLRAADGRLDRLTESSLYAETPGVGDIGRARLLASLELARRVAYLQKAHVKVIESSWDAFEVLKTLSNGPYEKLSALYMDRRHRVLAVRTLTVGNAGFTIVDPRQILRPAIEVGADAVVLAHHHPSGDPTPSDPDREVTRRVAAAGRVIGVQLLDHLVITPTQFCSLSERGELPAWDYDPSSIVNR